MTYLFAKYTLLFLLTAILSWLLGHWWARRRFVDVSDSFEELRRAKSPDSGSWKTLWQRFDTLDDSIGSTVKQELSALPQPDFPTTDLSGLNRQLVDLAGRFESMPAPKETDLSSVYQHLASLDKAISNLPQPTDVNFSPVNSRIDRLEKAIHAIPTPEKPPAVDLQPLQSRLSQLESAVKQVPTVKTHAPVDIGPLSDRIAGLERTVRALPRPSTVDLAPVSKRLGQIEDELKALRLKLARPAATPVAKVRKPSSGPRLLKSASHGKKDDLKRISGVGPKLEKMLNRNGVYYFWQVASWKNADIEIVDARLQVFKGRIHRDNWVEQARAMRKEAGSATEPA